MTNTIVFRELGDYYEIKEMGIKTDRDISEWLNRWYSYRFGGWVLKKDELETFCKVMREKVNCVIEFAGGPFVIHVDQADVENNILVRNQMRGKMMGGTMEIIEKNITNCLIQYAKLSAGPVPNKHLLDNIFVEIEKAQNTLVSVIKHINVFNKDNENRFDQE